MVWTTPEGTSAAETWKLGASVKEPRSSRLESATGISLPDLAKKLAVNPPKNAAQCTTPGKHIDIPQS
jgi:hypothetical protein